MDWQTGVTAVLVGACSAWSVWTFMPAALRERCRRRLGRPAATAGGSCGGCSGCGGDARAPGSPQIVTIVRRRAGG